VCDLKGEGKSFFRLIVFHERWGQWGAKCLVKEIESA